MFEDHGSTRIDLACPECRKMFKVRLRKLQFGADLTCRLCRHEFSAKDVSNRPDVQEALARMHEIVAQRVRSVKTGAIPDGTRGRTGDRQGGPITRATAPEASEKDLTGEALILQRIARRIGSP
ncbi:hypothetical protein [Microvirga pakistanensis]|uniref:hypothetical protein n=1 Tax=Microvirga pakistanensis TaxID=1682650 RepID=UPI00106AAF50|nr:hypothetical protein [Microvirga pakistanensis]